MKLVGILSVGSYYSPWTPFTLASIYSVCDLIVVVNGGFDLRDPCPDEWNIPLEKVSQDIAYLDIDEKIIEIKDFTFDDLEHKSMLMTQVKAAKKDMAKVGETLVWSGDWYDMRGLGITLANETAVKKGANMILKIDSDQVCYRDVIGLRRETKGLILHQTEFLGDVFHLAEPPPASPWNDSVFTYPVKKGQYYGGGGAPAIFVEREPTSKYHCAHLRYANPLFSTIRERFEHFKGRFIFHLFTNEYGVFCEELFERAEKMARDLLKRVGKPAEVSPPEVCLEDPLRYIEKIKRESEFRSR